MKFLVDESTGVKISQYLSQLGHDSFCVTEKFLGVSDEEVLRKAGKEKRIVITNDKDFSALIFYYRMKNQGVILLRLKDDSIKNKIRVIGGLLSEYHDKIQGNFVIISDDKVRLRKLPFKI